MSKNLSLRSKHSGRKTEAPFGPCLLEASRLALLGLVFAGSQQEKPQLWVREEERRRDRIDRKLGFPRVKTKTGFPPRIFVRKTKEEEEETDPSCQLQKDRLWLRCEATCGSGTCSAARASKGVP